MEIKSVRAENFTLKPRTPLRRGNTSPGWVSSASLNPAVIVTPLWANYEIKLRGIDVGPIARRAALKKAHLSRLIEIDICGNEKIINS